MKTLIAVLCGLLTATMSPLPTTDRTAAASSADPRDALAGRLGGSFVSFVDRFGDATEMSGSFGEVFAVEGYGVVGVQFDRRVAIQPEPGDPALLILLGAPRASLTSTRDPDPADWTVEVATNRARDFLPSDVVLGAATIQDAHTRVSECRSAALESVFGVLSLGSCRVVFVTPTATSVSFIALTLTGGAAAGGGAVSGADAGATAASCDGLSAWSRKSGRRLAQATALLDRVGRIPDGDPAAVATLRGIAQTFAALVEEQRSAGAPGAAARANYFIIAGLNGYAVAVGNAADGLEGDNAALVDQAVTGIDAANASIAKGTGEIAIAVGACGLSIATPMATP